MSSQSLAPKEKYESLIKDLRLQKSVQALEKIYQDLQSNKENIFNDAIVPYKFSSDFIWFIQYNVIDIKLQMDIFKLYIEAFFMNKQPLAKLKPIQFFFDIFPCDSYFYTQASNKENFLVFLNRFFNLYYPKKTSINHKEGDFMDVYITDERNKMILPGWTQLKIKRVDEEKKLYIFDDYKDNKKEYFIPIDNYKVQERNTFIKEEEMIWRDNLKKGDKLDFLNDNNNWVEAEIKEIISEKEISLSTFGQLDDNKIILNKYSPFIQPYLKCSFKYEPEEMNCLALLEMNSDFQKFSNAVPVNNINHLAPHDGMKVPSLQFYEILNFFVSKIIETKILTKETTSINYLYTILNIFVSTARIINQKFLGEYLEKNCFENIKKILINYSLDKKVNISKTVLDNIILYLECFLRFNNYPFQICKIFAEFIIDFGFNCFKYSEILEKRLLGLETIFKILELLSKYFSILPEETTEKISKVISDKLFNTKDNKDLLTLLYTDSNIHEQLTLRGVSIIILLAKLRLLKDEDIERLYNFSISFSDESVLLKSIFVILNTIAKEMDINKQKVIFKKIISLPYEKIRDLDITLMSYILQNIKNDNDFKEIAESFLNYFYNYIIQYKGNSYDKLANILTYAKSEENIKYLYCHYFEKLVNDLNNQNNLDDYKFYFNFLYYIFGCIDEKDERIKIYLPFLKNIFREIFLNKNKNMEIIVDKLLELDKNNNSKEENDEKNENKIIEIIDIILKLIKFIEAKNFYTFESMKKLSEYYIFSDVLRKKRSNFLYKIAQFKKEEFDKEMFYEYFFNRFDNYLEKIKPKTPEKYHLLDDLFVSSIFNIYQDINSTNEEILATDAEINRYLNEIKEYTMKKNPLQNKYFNIIWKMFSKYKYCVELSHFLEPFSLKNFSPSERNEIWEQLIKKIFEGIDNNVPLYLKMLELIIIFSENFGSGNAKAHFIELKKRIPVKLNIYNEVSNLLPEFNFSEEEDKFYSTDTVYDIKKRIKNKFGIDPIFLELNANKTKVLDYNKINEDNKALFELIPEIEKKDEIKIYFKKAGILLSLPEYPFKTENGITPKFEQVLREIFNKFAKNGQLDLNSYKKFFSDSVRVKALEEMEKSAVESFNKYDVDNKGYWNFDNFLLFFSFSIEKKKGSIYLNLTNLGYDSSLDYYLSPLDSNSPLYYEENNNKKFMPRYFIANNKSYMEKIFSYAKNEDKDILEKAQNLLQQLCTSEEIKKMIFEKEDKIEDIITNENLELRAYVFDILLSEFEKDNKDETQQNLVNNFIKYNLNKIIIELEKFNKGSDNNENGEKDNKIVRYFNYYLSNLKIIFYAMKTIMENNDIIDSIDKFGSLEYNNEKNVFKVTKIELNQDKKNLINNFQLINLINIIGNNITILEYQKNEIYKQGINLSFKILIYLILFSQYLPDNEKIEIYKMYINFEITLTQTSSFNIEDLFYKANKLLINFMNNEIDKKYILTKYEKAEQEIINCDKLIKLEWKASTFIDMFIDLIEISIKGGQNDKIFSIFENLLRIILDKNNELNETLIIGYLNIIKTILTILAQEKYVQLYQYDFEPLINKIIQEFIITFDKDEKNKIIEINNLKNYSRYSSYDYIDYIYKIITIIISLNPLKYLKIFFLNEDIENIREKHLTKIDEALSEYNPQNNCRNYTNYIGLRNLSSICYMNSVLQQFFMITLFRNAILSLTLPKDCQEDKEETDNFLFQLIRLFYYLNHSEKGEYNPKDFVFSFKDYDGNPTRIDVQCDAQEFLSRYIEKVEDCLKNDKNKYLLYNILGGTTLQQVKCTNPECGNISERREHLNFLSLDIKDTTNLKECLYKYIKEEKIEDYHCEKCDKKITNIKNVLIEKIPNILIIHLQRITFSYTTFNMVKINNYISFEKTLNIKNYTVNNKNSELPPEYFDYDLKGIIIHSGTAQYGHYYSAISRENEDTNDSWIKFNDSSVTYVNYNDILSDAFGKSDQNQYSGSSAYMLVYQKRIKKPVIINCKELDDNIKTIIEEKKEENLEKIELDNGVAFYIYETEKDAIEKNIDININSKENELNKNIIIKNGLIQAKLVSYNEAINSLIKENENKTEEKPFLNKILLENIRICNDKKFYTKTFSEFIKEETKIIKEEIIHDKTGQKIIEYIPILKAINDYIIHIISFCNELEDSKEVIQNIIDIFEYSIPKELLTYLIKDIIEPDKENLYKNYFCSRCFKKAKIISTYIGRILSCCINNNIENDLTLKIIQFYLDKIPVEITKYWLDMEGFNNLILTLVQNSDKMKIYFINNEIITKLMDLILGKESPLYKGDERVENKNNKPQFGNVVNTVALLYQYYADNYQKEELKLSENDIVLINNIKFYEKVLIDDYDSEASIKLIKYKMELDKKLNKEEDKGNLDKEIIDIIIRQRIPPIKTNEEIISGLKLIIEIIKTFYEINEIELIREENNDKKNKFLEILNLLIGIPIATVNNENAEIKYISAKYYDNPSILNKISVSKEKKKESLNLLKTLFDLFNINKTVFDYINKLPAPNSFKYSFVDYYIKSFIILEKEITEEEDLKNELNNLLKEICTKYNKDLDTIKNKEQIDLDNSLYFHEFLFHSVTNISLPEKVKIFQGKLYYISGKNVEKTTLPCFINNNYFINVTERKSEENLVSKNGYELNCILCVVVHSENEQYIIINFKPYIYSDMIINAKKDNHYFIYCYVPDDKIKNDDKELDKIIDFSHLKIETEVVKKLDLPLENNNQPVDDACTINCPLCGTANILNEGNPDFKCMFCESPLF